MTSAKDAIIMCRVSSAKQNTGNSLSLSRKLFVRRTAKVRILK